MDYNSSGLDHMLVVLESIEAHLILPISDIFRHALHLVSSDWARLAPPSSDHLIYVFEPDGLAESPPSSIRQYEIDSLCEFSFFHAMWTTHSPVPQVTLSAKCHVAQTLVQESRRAQAAARSDAVSVMDLKAWKQDP